MNSASAETYLRQFAESLLRRVANGKLTSDECSSRVRSVAAAFEGTGVLDAALADSVHADIEVALAARSPQTGTLMHLGRRAPFSMGPGLPGVSHMLSRSATGHSGKKGGGQEPAGEIWATPVGAVLRIRADRTRRDSTHEDRAPEDRTSEDPAPEDRAPEDPGDGASGDEDVYLLGYVAARGRAWLAVAARTDERPARRPASPPSARNAGARMPAPRTFAGGGMTAIDDAGQRYRLGFSGGGSKWYLGRLALNPAPPAYIAWLDVRCGTESVRVDLTARAPAAEVTVLPLAVGRGEAYLLQRTETLLTRPAFAAAEAAGMSDLIPALRAAGVLAGDSPVPGQIAALCERLGALGHLIAPPGPLPERWEAFLAATEAGAAAGQPIRSAFDDTSTIDAARLAVVLPAGDGITVVLSGLITAAGGATIIFGGLYLGPDPADAAVAGNFSMWLRDDGGGWHSASVNGWSSDASSGVSFQAIVVPALTPGTSGVEFYVTGFSGPESSGAELSGTGLSGMGPTGEIRAVVPLEWWSVS